MSPAESSPQADPPQPQQGWFARNWLWFVPTVLVLPPLLCVGCCGGLFAALIGGLRNTEVYTTAIGRIEADPQITSALGEPITVDLVNFHGNVDQSTDGGTASYQFQIRGPAGVAPVVIEAHYDGQRWVYDTFEVTLPSGDIVSLVE